MRTTNKIENQRVITAKDFDDLFDRLDWHLLDQLVKSGKGLIGIRKRIELAIVRRAIKEHHGNKTDAARFLNLTYRWVHKVVTERSGD